MSAIGEFYVCWTMCEPTNFKSTISASLFVWLC